MKTAVIGGGGSWGAYTVGKLAALNHEYQLVVGCSTGSLMAPLVALGEWDRLKESYSSVTTKDIFNVNPFKKNGNINVFMVLWRIICGKDTIGETEGILTLIKKFFTIDDYNRILAQDKNVIVTVCNITKSQDRTEFHSIRDYDYETFCLYMWASSSFPIVGTLVKINDSVYVDGGTTNGVPVYHSIVAGGTDIDIFLHSVQVNTRPVSKISNVFHLIMRMINVQRSQIASNNEQLSAFYTQIISALSKEKIVTSKYYLAHYPEKPYLYFDKELMTQWINEGYEEIKNSLKP